MSRISLSVPSFNGNEWKYVKDCIDSEWVSSAGKFVTLFEEKIAKYTGSKYAIACVNGTSAIQLSLRMIGVAQGDEVIVPTLTFIAPINAIYYNGGSPIFMDSDKHCNIDVEKTIDFIQKETIYKRGFTYNKRTNNKIKAIIPVHVWGNAVYLDELYDICFKKNIKIIEDSSESLGTFYSQGKFSGKHSGTIGDIGCLSFNGNKIITTGGGGMILTDDCTIADKARYLTTQAKDDPINYIHNEVGYNFRLTNMQAALGLAQLENIEKILKNKKYNYKQYSSRLNANKFQMLAPPDYATNNHWLNILMINQESNTIIKDELIQKLNNNDIESRPIWHLNHLQKPYSKNQNYKIELAFKLVDKSVCLPSSSNLSDDSLSKIISILNG